MTTNQQHSRISILADDLYLIQTVDTTQKRMLEGFLVAILVVETPWNDAKEKYRPAIMCVRSEMWAAVLSLQDIPRTLSLP